MHLVTLILDSQTFVSASGLTNCSPLLPITSLSLDLCASSATRRKEVFLPTAVVFLDGLEPSSSPNAGVLWLFEPLGTSLVLDCHLCTGMRNAMGIVAQ